MRNKNSFKKIKRNKNKNQVVLIFVIYFLKKRLIEEVPGV
jgi:hypothetical protein